MHTRRWRIIREYLSLIGFFGFCAALIAGILGPAYQLYHGWTERIIGVLDVGQFSLDADPFDFFTAVALNVVAILVLVLLLAAMNIFGASGFRAERKFFRRRERQPPLDNAVREQFDRSDQTQ
jgi:hypothetical protein